MPTSLPRTGQVGSDSDLRVLMIGTVPRIYGGISAVVGMLLDFDLPSRCRLTYVGRRQCEGPLAKLRCFLGAVLQTGWLLLTGRVDVIHLHVGDGGSLYRHNFIWRLADWLVYRSCFIGTCPAMPARRRSSMRPAARRGDG